MGPYFSAVMMENGELNSSLDEFIALLEEDLQKGSACICRTVAVVYR